MADNCIITIKSLVKYYGERLILNNLNASFQEGCRVCLLGNNGAGKSTLMRIISGDDNAYDGNVTKKRLLTFGYLHQEPLLEPEKTVWDNIYDSLSYFRGILDKFYNLSEEMALNEDEKQLNKMMEEQSEIQEKIEQYDLWDLDRQIQTIMSSLSCPQGDKLAKNLSEGERRRVALCQLLLQRNDVLMLDEPTNHLDVFSIDWLINYLNKYQGSLFFVSHSRDFTDKLATEVLEIANGSAYKYAGNYSAWILQKEKRSEMEKSQNDKLAKLLEKEREWVNQAPKARLTKSKSRIENYNTMVESFQEKRYNEMEIPLQKPARLGHLVLRVKNLRKTIGDRVLIDNFSFSLIPGQILGIVGPNGAGKSTLLNILVGLDQDYSGTVEIGTSVRMSHLSQIRQDMEDNRTVWEEITNGVDFIDLGGELISSRQYCGSFNFKGNDQQKIMSTLSGGERCRVHLAKSLLKLKRFNDNQGSLSQDSSGANLLMLDEPTNDLDLDTVIALENSLMNFAGCAVIVSHDTWFLNKVCTHICVSFGNGEVIIEEGNYESVVNEKIFTKMKKISQS